MQIGKKCIEYLLVNMLECFFKIHKFEKTHFHAFSFGNGLNKFQFGIIQCITT